MNSFVAGASSGIGQAVAEQLLQRGDHVAVTARRAERLEAIKGALACPGDLKKSTDIAAALARANEVYPGIDRLYNFAGGALLLDPQAELTPEITERIRELVELNTMGSVRLLKQALPYLNEGAHVGICSSLITQTDQPVLAGTAIYYWTKKLMESALNSQRQMLADRGISLTIIRPGLVDTEAWRAAGKETWQGVPDVVRLVGRVGFKASDCAKQLIADTEAGKELSFPTLDSKLASEHPRIHEAMLRLGSPILERTLRRPNKLK